MPFTKIGTAIQLNLQLEGGDTDKFVRAILRDADGVLLTTITLSHTGDGIYQDDSYIMPNTNEVTATYIIYDDAAFTEETCEYGRSVDVFELDETLEIVECIKSDVTSLISGNLPGDLIEGFLQDESMILGEICYSDEMLEGCLDDSQTLIMGHLYDDNEICGHIESGSIMLEGYIIEENKTNVIGQIEC